MKAILVFALLTLAGALAHSHDGHDHSHSHAHSHGGASNVLVLDGANFDLEIGAHSLTLVEFYAPWCGHCKKLEPEYDQASLDLEGEVDLKLAKVDCTSEKDLCAKYGVKGFPTLKLFRTGGAAPVEYQAARKASAIVEFMRKQSAPAFTVLSSATAVNEFTKTHSVAILGFFSAMSDADAVVYLEVANTLRNDYSFGIVADSAVALATSNSVGSIAMYKSFDEPKVVFSGSKDADAITEFVKSESFPLVGEIGPENFQKYVQRDLPLVWVFLDFSNTATPSTLEAVAGAAAAYKGKFSFVKIDGVKWAEHAKSFGLSGGTPAIVLEDRVKNKNFVFPEDAPITTAALSAHVQGFLDKTLAATVKSEEVPASNDGPVKVVVGKTFDSIVMDTSKDVFVKFYAPWCGHCKTLAPKWEQLGTDLKDLSNVVIAKVDSTANDVPADIKGFPTLLLYKAGDKAHPVTYGGERTVAALNKWVRETVGAPAAPAASQGHEEL